MAVLTADDAIAHVAVTAAADVGAAVAVGAGGDRTDLSADAAEPRWCGVAGAAARSLRAVGVNGPGAAAVRTRLCSFGNACLAECVAVVEPFCRHPDAAAARAFGDELRVFGVAAAADHPLGTASDEFTIGMATRARTQPDNAASATSSLGGEVVQDSVGPSATGAAQQHDPVAESCGPDRFQQPQQRHRAVRRGSQERVRMLGDMTIQRVCADRTPGFGLLEHGLRGLRDQVGADRLPENADQSLPRGGQGSRAVSWAGHCLPGLRITVRRTVIGVGSACAPAVLRIC